MAFPYRAFPPVVFDAPPASTEEPQAPPAEEPVAPPVTAAPQPPVPQPIPDPPSWSQPAPPVPAPGRRLLAELSAPPPPTAPAPGLRLLSELRAAPSRPAQPPGQPEAPRRFALLDDLSDGARPRRARTGRRSIGKPPEGQARDQE